jgi:hypothetical protein
MGLTWRILSWEWGCPGMPRPVIIEAEEREGHSGKEEQIAPEEDGEHGLVSLFEIIEVTENALCACLSAVRLTVQVAEEHLNGDFMVQKGAFETHDAFREDA